MKVWIFIWRLNPPHLWHLEIIKKSLETDDKTMVILGSSNIFDERNPFSVEQRKRMLEMNFSVNSLIIDSMSDKESDLDWVLGIKNIILKNIKNIREISFYGWDFKNDSAIIVLKQFTNHIWFQNIKFIEYNRKKLYFVYDWEKIYYSSTLVRDAIIKKDKSLLKKLLSPEIYKNIENSLINV